MVMVMDVVDMGFAVAEAIGLKNVALAPMGDKVLITPREWDEIRGIEHPTCEGDVACIPFMPSVDLNHAFAAAEVVKLFNDEVPPGYRRCLFRVLAGWCVGGSGLYEEAPTPALAICAAILKLKESSNGE